VFALPIFPGERSERRRWRIKRGERVAAVGVQRRRSDAKAHTGHRNRKSPQKFVGERTERCRWQMQRGERVAAVDEGRRCFGTEEIRRAPQQGYMCLTSVFGLVTSPSAAGGGCSEGAVRAGVGGQRRRSRQGVHRGTPTGHEPERRRWRMQRGCSEGSGRRGTKVLRHRGHSSGTATGNRWTVHMFPSIKAKEPGFLLALLSVRVTYLPGQSPAKYCRRTCA